MENARLDTEKPAVTTSQPVTPTIEAVREYWESHACGEFYLDNEKEASPDYFDTITSERYKWHYHLPSFLREVAQNGGKTLEIGCGMGIDSSQLAQLGVDLTSVDLTTKGIELAKSNFKRLGLSADLRVGNAEALEFSDKTFDTVYSFGVLHHTENTEHAIDEVWRVLKPGGRAFIMLYSRFSLNRLVHNLLRSPYENRKDDGPDAPVTRVYSHRELRQLFRRFTDLSFRKRYLFGGGYKPIVYFIPRIINHWFGLIVGWHWLIVAQKPEQPE